MKIETKFFPGEIIWNIYNGKANKFTVEKVTTESRINGALEIQYYINIGTEKDYKPKIVDEKDCFATREELINSL
jgi:hypothetical protein